MNILAVKARLTELTERRQTLVFRLETAKKSLNGAEYAAAKNELELVDEEIEKLKKQIDDWKAAIKDHVQKNFSLWEKKSADLSKRLLAIEKEFKELAADFLWAYTELLRLANEVEALAAAARELGMEVALPSIDVMRWENMKKIAETLTNP